MWLHSLKLGKKFQRDSYLSAEIPSASKKVILLFMKRSQKLILWTKSKILTCKANRVRKTCLYMFQNLSVEAVRECTQLPGR